jgi:hypothetical protein
VTFSLEIRLDALRDIEEAAEWYEAQKVGLGVDFAHVALEAIDSLPINPLVHRLRGRRRELCSKGRVGRSSRVGAKPWDRLAYVGSIQSCDHF